MIGLNTRNWDRIILNGADQPACFGGRDFIKLLMELPIIVTAGLAATSLRNGVARVLVVEPVTPTQKPTAKSCGDFAE